ncbi:hypothetical protein [Roseomonas chloroacetimidivorans]|uniref:hypothetical protein n=1 Tax=Roseomonas chloroacetimidivorans TaxID=1766656 RepID=UPI003C7377F1
MFSVNLSRALRTLGLAAALMSPLAAGHAFADGEYIAGPTAVGSWAQAHPESRTPLAGQSARTQGEAALESLEQSGATGAGGQHA